jgi:hypothetical protein
MPVAVALLLAGGCAGSADRATWQPAAAPASAPSSPAPKPKPKPKLESSNEVKGPLGDVIETGLKDGEGRPYVIFGVTGLMVNDSSDFGFAIGVRKPGNVITEDLTISEYEGSAIAPGFHPMAGQQVLSDDSVQPAFGYYVGAPAKITVRELDRVIGAQLARWSHNPAITVFWFDPANVRDDGDWTDLGAYDGAGNRLPEGHIERQTL